MIVQGVVDNNVYPPRFGLTVRVWNLYRGLARRSDVARVRVICALKSRESAPALERREGVEIVRIKTWHPTAFAWLERARLAPLFLVAEGHRAWPRPFARVWDLEADILQMDTLPLVPLWRAAPRGVLRVYGSTNVEVEWFERVGARVMGRKRWTRRLAELEREALEGADLVLAVSAEDRDSFVARYGVPAAKIAVIENGFDAEQLRVPTAEEKRGARSALGLGDGEVGLLFLGSDFEHNRQAVAHLFAHVVPSLAELGARLYLVGEVAPRFRPRAEAEGGGRVRALPTQSDLTPYLWGCDVGLNPVTAGAGSNVKLPTYLAAGLGVVSTAFGMRGFDRLRSCVEVAVVEDFPAALQRAHAARSCPARPGMDGALASYSWQAQADRLAEAYAARLAAR